MTASRALRGARDVSPDSVAKVQAAAGELGYVGNHLASALSGQRSDLVGVVVPSLTNIIFAEVLSGIAEGLEGSGLQPVFGVTEYNLEKETSIIRNMLSWFPAGLIVTGLDQAPEARRLLTRASVPVVQIMDLDGAPVDRCVGLSHGQAGAALAQSLLARGCRRIGFAGASLDRDTRAAKRLAGFRKALSDAGIGLAAEQVVEGPTTVALGVSLTERMLAEHPGLDCIHFSNDDLAAGGAFHCLRQGISVPDQLVLAGFNGLDLLDSLPVQVTSCRTPRREIGRVAAQMVQEPEPLGSPIREFAPMIMN